MAKLTFTLYGKEYTLNCAEGEQQRLKDVIDFVAGKMTVVGSRVGNTTEPRLLMLTCLQLADELLEARRQASESQSEEQELIIAAVQHLKDRVANIASQVGRA